MPKNTDPFVDLKEVVNSYLDAQEAVIKLSNGFQIGEDVPAITKLFAGLPAAVDGFNNVDDAIEQLTAEQRQELFDMIDARQSFPNPNTEEYVDDFIKGAFYWARGLVKALKKEE